MKHFELLNSFLTGHRQIDAEHTQLVALFNACIDISNENGAKADFCVKFSEFEVAICDHIKHEETIMTELGYFEADADVQAHAKGGQIFRELSKDCQLNVEMEMILKQARHALMELIIKSDLGFKAYLENIGYKDA